MATTQQGYERLKYEMERGNVAEKIHIVWVEREQQERIKNAKRQMKFVLNTQDPDLCACFQLEKDRIIKRCKNKTVAMHCMLLAWHEGLSDPELDRLLARGEVEGGKA